MSVAELSDVAGVQQGVELPEGTCIRTDDYRSNVIVKKQYCRPYCNEYGRFYSSAGSVKA